MTRARLAVLISGRGTNLQALLDAATTDGYPAEIALVISNRPDAAGLVRARNAGVEAIALDHKKFGKGEKGRAAFDAVLHQTLETTNVDYICLAGFMRLFTADFAQKWRGKMINIHPSLLPAFKGLNVHERMIEQGVKIAGCTVHFVSPAMDEGPIIGQAALAVRPDDTPETLADRILELEHKLYPSCVRLLVEGKARISANNRVKLPEDEATETKIVFPDLLQDL
ncbi:MAG: phosphoribosylglycinamide formyltransferase [Pseudomonadota bacterium]